MALYNIAIVVFGMKIYFSTASFFPNVTNKPDDALMYIDDEVYPAMKRLILTYLNDYSLLQKRFPDNLPEGHTPSLNDISEGHIEEIYDLPCLKNIV